MIYIYIDAYNIRYEFGTIAIEALVPIGRSLDDHSRVIPFSGRWSLWTNVHLLLVTSSLWHRQDHPQCFWLELGFGLVKYIGYSICCAHASDFLFKPPTTMYRGMIIYYHNPSQRSYKATKPNTKVYHLFATHHQNQNHLFGVSPLMETSINILVGGWASPLKNMSQLKILFPYGTI